MKRKLVAFGAAFAVAAVGLAGCASDGAKKEEEQSTAAAGGATESGERGEVKLWLIGGDTPDNLRDWLVEEYSGRTGGTLTIEEQTWGDIVTNLTTSMPDPSQPPM